MAAINAASGLQLAAIIIKENRKKENETSCCWHVSASGMA
jgi:hypothetical protein